MKPLLLAVALSLPVFAAENVIKDKQGMDCHVYTPDTIDPDKTYQLVVGVHGAGGKGNGAAGMKSWASRGDVIVIGPSFETQGERPYQGGEGIHAEKLIELFETLKKTYKLHDKMFLYGFSGGCQFTHRFTMKNSKWVCGVSAHSGGSWATDGFGDITAEASNIPFAISCGEKDTQFSFQGALFNRIDWYGRFRDEIDKKNFCYIADSWPDVGHSASAGVWVLTKECFQLATGLPGENATQKVEISPEWKNLDKLKRNESRGNQKTSRVGPSISEAELEKITQAAFAKADSEKVSHDLLIKFLKKHPATVWKDKPGSANLLEQCKDAATAWRTAAKSKKMWDDSLKQQFSDFTEGLDIAAE